MWQLRGVCNLLCGETACGKIAWSTSPSEELWHEASVLSVAKASAHVMTGANALAAEGLEATRNRGDIIKLEESLGREAEDSIVAQKMA